MKYRVILTFTECILGATPKDPNVYEEYIASRAALDDEELAQELASVGKMEEKGWTGFHRVDDQPVLYNYVIKGFFKDACGMLRRIRGSSSAKVRAYKKEIDGLVFVEPRQIPLVLPPGGEIDVLERPLRASGPRGERVALARSDTCPPGTTLTFTVTVLGGTIDQDLLEDWLEYGHLRGLGQWRNAGYGAFEYDLQAM